MSYILEKEMDRIRLNDFPDSSEYDVKKINNLITQSLLNNNYEETKSLISRLAKQMIPQFKLYHRERMTISEHLLQTAYIKAWALINNERLDAGNTPISAIDDFHNLMESYEYTDYKHIKKKTKPMANERIDTNKLHLSKLNTSDNKRELKQHNFSNQLNRHVDIYCFIYNNVYKQLKNKSGKRDFSYFNDYSVNKMHERTYERMYYYYFYNSLMDNPLKLLGTNIKYTEILFLKEHNIPLAIAVARKQQELAIKRFSPGEIDQVCKSLFLIDYLLPPQYYHYAINRLDNLANLNVGAYSWSGKFNVNSNEVTFYTNLYSYLENLIKILIPTLEKCVYNFYNNKPLEAIVSVINNNLSDVEIFDYAINTTSENTVQVVQEMNKSNLNYYSSSATDNSENYDLFELFRSATLNKEQ